MDGKPAVLKATDGGDSSSNGTKDDQSTTDAVCSENDEHNADIKAADEKLVTSTANSLSVVDQTSSVNGESGNKLSQVW